MGNSNLQGRAVFWGISGSKGLRKAIGKHLDHWFEAWSSGNRDTDIGAETAYTVSFEREGEGHEVICRTEICAGKERRLWVSVDSGANPLEALERCLRRVGNPAVTVAA